MQDQADPLEHLRLKLADRYAFKGELGRGAMATVYLAEDLKHHRQVAIKVMHSDLAAGLGADRFLREISVVAQLQHPNIVPLYDSGQADGLLYYVMPYIEGGSLQQRLDTEKQLPIEEALGIADAVAGALAHAHSRGIVHRDIKPANILLSRDRPLVADFGLARAVTRGDSAVLTAAGLAVGTALYMSPEQASAGRDVDGRSDVYALGCVLFEMLAGEPPFTGVTPQAIVAQHLSALPPAVRVVRPSVPPRMAKALERALAKVPADRFPTAAAFAAALRTAAATPSRRPWWAVAALGLLGAAAVFLVRQSSGPPGSRVVANAAIGDLHRIAVLYFEDASADGALRWLTRGLTEDLIDLLGTVPGLTVTSRNGVRPYAGGAASPDSIGRALGVGLLVDGTVEPAGRARDSVRVWLRLVEASNAVQLDRLSLAGSLRQPLALRRDLAGEMERLLRRRIGAHVTLREERQGAGNDVAWEYLRRARELREDARGLQEADEGGAAVARLIRADSLLEAAEAEERSWVQPTIERAELALVRAFASEDTTVLGASPTSLLEAAARHAERALRRAPTEPRALMIHGETLFRLRFFGEPGSRDSLIPAAYRDLSRATELRPDLARAWLTLSEVLLALGRPGESRLAAQKALAADRYAADAPEVITRLFLSVLDRGSVAEADSLCAVGRHYYPTNPNFLECELTVLGWFGRGPTDVAGAWRIVHRLDTVAAVEQSRLHRRLFVAAVLARSGERDSARAVIRTTRALAPDELTRTRFAFHEAYLWVLLGEPHRAVELLRPLTTEDPEMRPWLARHPWFVGLRDDPTFQALLKTKN